MGSLYTTIWNSDFKYLCDICDYLIGHFKSNFVWEVQPVLPLGRAIVNAENTEPKSFLHQYLVLLEYAKEKYDYQNIKELMYPNSVCTYSCGSAPFNYRCLWLLPNGEVVTCIESMTIKSILAKVIDGKFNWIKDINDPLTPVITNIRKECQDCIAYSFCKGGCPIRYLEFMKSKTSLYHWQCNESQKYIEFLIQQLINHRTYFDWNLTQVDDGIFKMWKTGDDYAD